MEYAEYQEALQGIKHLLPFKDYELDKLPEYVTKLAQIPEPTIIALWKALTLSSERETTDQMPKHLAMRVTQCNAQELKAFCALAANHYVTCLVDFEDKYGFQAHGISVAQAITAVMTLDDPTNPFTVDQQRRLTMIIMTAHWVRGVKTLVRVIRDSTYKTILAVEDTYLIDYVRSNPSQEEYERVMELLCNSNHDRFIEVTATAQGETTPLISGIL